MVMVEAGVTGAVLVEASIEALLVQNQSKYVRNQ
jgi:hypothetical protein